MRSHPAPHPAPHPASHPAQAVPVALALGERHVGSVRRWIEGTLGWQAVDDDLDGPVPPSVRIVDIEGAVRLLDAGHEASRADRLPTLLLVEDDDVVALAADVARRLQPAGVCRWPDGRDALPDLVVRAVSQHRPGAEAGRVLRVGGIAGGVGTTTVVLALTGIAAWSGERALAVVHGQAGVREATPVPPDAVVSPDLWSRATPLPGVDGARVVHTGPAAPARVPTDRRIDLSIVDVGTSAEPDIVVCRPDRGAVEQLPVTMAGAVVVVGRGLLSDERIAELAGGRRVVHVPTSVRVARAVLRGHVPAGLPGTWLAALRPLLEVA
jgi:hypothetical protein